MRPNPTTPPSRQHVQRAPHPTPQRPTATDATTTTSTTDSPVPTTLVTPMHRALDADVSAVPVRRGAPVTRTAHHLDARAFTATGVVHVPDEVGALDGHDAAPLLAHELTHAVQQRRFGAALPAADTALGRQLEAEAVAVEEWVAGGAVTSPPRVWGHLDQPQLAARVAEAPREPDWWAEANRIPDLDPANVTREYERATGSRVADSQGAFDLQDDSLGGMLARFRGLMDQSDQPGKPGQTGQPGTPEEQRRQLLDEIADNPPRRWFDLDDLRDFDELANRIYNHLHSRLRFDVLVERERSGTLMDFG